jgi:hypothetical protein
MNRAKEDMMQSAIEMLANNGWSDDYDKGWEAFAAQMPHTLGAWPEFDRGWFAHYTEGL